MEFHICDFQGIGKLEDEIIDQFNIFLFAGMDTTGHLAAMSMYEMAVHPEVQDKVRAEVNSLIPGDPLTDLVADHLPQLKYL